MLCLERVLREDQVVIHPSYLLRSATLSNIGSLLLQPKSSFPPDIDSDPDMDPDLNDDADEPESMSRHVLMTAVANERATELILDRGLLAPLEKLSNVQSFQFKFETKDRNGELYKPTAKHLEMLMDLKRKN